MVIAVIAVMSAAGNPDVVVNDQAKFVFVGYRHGYVLYVNPGTDLKIKAISGFHAKTVSNGTEDVNLSYITKDGKASQYHWTVPKPPQVRGDIVEVSLQDPGRGMKVIASDVRDAAKLGR